MDLDLRAQSRCREDQRLDSNRVDVEFDWICGCIGTVGPLICVIVRNTETIRKCIAAALAPKERVRVRPNRFGLTTKEEIRIELVRFRGALVRLIVD